MTYYFITCLLTAVFYRGAVDPRLVVRRTAVYAIVTGTLVFTFAIFENYVADLMGGFLGLSSGMVQGVGAGAVALLLKPLHDLLGLMFKKVIPDASPEREAAA